MPVQYTNRVGKTYYLRKSATKTGAPRYFFSAQPEGKGEAVDHIPEGYEVYEHPQNAQVFLRQKRPQLITDSERQLVETHVNQLKRSKRYRVDCKGKVITIYESNADVDHLKGIFGGLLKGSPLAARMGDDEAMHTLLGIVDQHYTAMMRFRLFDEERRTFTAERFCFRGAIDDWIDLGGPDELKKLVNKWVKVLGTDKFYDAPYL
jgi:hypothetical protein